jgi:hypothetical protein
MVEFVVYALFVLVMIGALRYMMAGVELEPSTNDNSPVVPVAPTGTDGSSSAQ